MKNCFLLVLAPALAGLAGIGGAQDAPRPHPSFSIKLTGPEAEVKVGAPIPLKVTFTNISDHDFRTGSIPCSECKTGARRDIDLKVYDSDGKLVPEMPYGRRIHGREADQLRTPVSVFSSAIKPGNGFRENANLREEFELQKPGRYTVQAERPDPYSNGLMVKSNTITISLVE
jgi:hypothetical protein